MVTSEERRERKNAYMRVYREASKEQLAAYREANREKLNAYNKEYYQANKEKLAEYREANKERKAAYRAATKEQRAAYMKSYNQANREKLNAYARDYVQANPGKINAQSAKRRAARIQRTPNWLTPDDYHAIRTLYETAAALTESTGIKHHVDHIIPLRGKIVSGFHCPTNLQILTATENHNKYNKFTGEH